jgi:hypothetical protein
MPTRSPHDEPPGPAAPTIPSFASLRSTARHSAVDLLVAGPGPAAPADTGDAAPPSAPAAPGRAGGPAPRPAEYGDLLRFGLRAVRAVAGVPWCVLSRLRAAAGR